MISYPLRSFDEQRSEILRRYEILQNEGVFNTEQGSRTAAELFDVPIAIVAMNVRYQNWYKSSFGVADEHPNEFARLCAHAHLAEMVFSISDVRAEPDLQGMLERSSEPKVSFWAGAPLLDPDGRRLGTLCLFDTSPRRTDRCFDSKLASFAKMLSEEICLRSAGRYAVKELIEGEQEKSELYDLAVSDPLTGALNRRAFFRFLEREVRRSKRHSVDLSLLAIDIDHFKRVNDTYGHAIGDEVLKSVAASISKDKRDEDLFGRLGGEEFALALPETNIAEAHNFAMRILNRIKNIQFNSANENFSITLSAGISIFEQCDSDINQTLKRADQALYSAKKNGRDRIECNSQYINLEDPSKETDTAVAAENEAAQRAA